MLVDFAARVLRICGGFWWWRWGIGSLIGRREGDYGTIGRVCFSFGVKEFSAYIN
jgi:hypothetical protein